MKHSTDDSSLHTNLLQAIHKNKIIQGKLTECQRLYYVQLVKDMEMYNLKEKYNRELLYAWKKESYVRQLKKNLQEYQSRGSDVKDAYYEYQAKTLSNSITGQQALFIPPSEEERRLNINAKYHQFLQKNPLQTSSMRIVKSAAVLSDQKVDKKEEEDALGVETTWKHIHAQSALGLRRKAKSTLPNIHRSSTMQEVRRNTALARSLAPPTVAIVSSVLVTTTPELVNSSSNEKLLSSKSTSNRSTLPDGIEPILITSETLQKYTREDLVTMRSVRRPRKNPSDLNLLFETRKRIYQINKRALDHQSHQRKCGLQYNIQFNRAQQIDLNIQEQNVPLDSN
jgi:hypothetical protein